MKPSELLLGKQTPVVDHYAPELLFPIPRQEGREQLGLVAPLPFEGADIWHAYELSWLDANDKAQARVGRFSVPAGSPNLVESKSFKLYLNSLNNAVFADDAAACACITGDLSAAAGANVTLALFPVDDPALAGGQLPGICIDGAPGRWPRREPEAAMLQCSSADVVEEKLYSHLLRSLCPVTGQPDWATLWLHYRGPALEHAALLSYILAYREHQDFHEQCVERIFRDLQKCVAPEFLHLQAFYTRRGGLDINPYRSSGGGMPLNLRLGRQ
ncbi:NADPH-dependent 7-cyano-7-deazaguanine reductase QueF [Kineobactrum sediminis]|uniref:NADPH-dependent 7-cyano-7-deazaguanine reductase n=1 Tax=Kineobactrum sediminis TaxID=1905677 RepID=A0A2N5Y4H4_9GAMM|nr:NADPH-dependent 7-cyano-7-deazaguanine reductase QueF [Kineobactrum sediminis]PLW83295.1 NADPH-dependent 7-cyano-7-deazaguanine reductase QueF [Kineobactrum sediminis]